MSWEINATLGPVIGRRGLSGDVVFLQLFPQRRAIDPENVGGAGIVAVAVVQDFLEQRALELLDQRLVQWRRCFAVERAQVIANAGFDVVTEWRALGLRGSVGHDAEALRFGSGAGKY